MAVALSATDTGHSAQYNYSHTQSQLQLQTVVVTIANKNKQECLHAWSTTLQILINNKLKDYEWMNQDAAISCSQPKPSIVHL